MTPSTDLRLQASTPRFRGIAATHCHILLISLLTLAFCACSAPTPSEVPADEWRQWRGANGQGVSDHGALPTTWSEGAPHIRFKTFIPGAANSSPVVSNGRVFMTTTFGTPEDDWKKTWKAKPLKRAVVSVDLETGELLWHTTLFSGYKGKIHHTNTRATPSPATDGTLVFVNFDNILAALDFDGAIVWEKDVDPDYYKYAHYGVSSSPVLVGDVLVLQQDREESTDHDVGWIAGFEKATGEQLWRDEWTETCCSYTTPVVVTREGGKVELVMSTSKLLKGYDPETGALLWDLPHPSIQPVPSLLVDGDILVAPGGVHDTGLIAYRMQTTNDPAPGIELWQTERGVPQIPTSLIYEGRLFLLADNGILTAHDLETGKRLWRGRASPGNYWPSLVAGDGKIYASNQYGVVTVVDARADKFTLLAKNELDEPNKGATPAIAGGCLLLRARNQLYCIEAEEPAVGGEEALAQGQSQG